MSHQANRSTTEIGNTVFQVLTIALVGLLGLAETVRVVFSAIA